MNARTKSSLILAATLIVGAIIGSLATSAVHNQRWEELRSLGSRDGFIEVMESVIQPVDAQQQVAIRNLLSDYTEEISEVRRTYYAERRATMEAMRSRLAPLLNEEQQQRLEAWFNRDFRSRRRSDDRNGRSSKGHRESHNNDAADAAR